MGSTIWLTSRQTRAARVHIYKCLTCGYRWEWPRQNLALLETALAVHLFRLERGRYPARLREIEP